MQWILLLLVVLTFSMPLAAAPTEENPVKAMGEVELQDAAGDIDEEIARLNRLVHDVLDFARPIRFECAPTDANLVCQDAARAVSADGHEAPTLHLQTVPAVVTDRERLRTVLVNLLTNAQHAVPAAGQPTGEAISVGMSAAPVRRS